MFSVVALILCLVLWGVPVVCILTWRDWVDEWQDRYAALGDVSLETVELLKNGVQQ